MVTSFASNDHRVIKQSKFKLKTTLCSKGMMGYCLLGQVHKDMSANPVTVVYAHQSGSRMQESITTFWSIREPSGSTHILADVIRTSTRHLTLY